MKCFYSVRKVIYLLLAGLALFSVACKKQEGGGAAASSGEVVKPTKIVYMASTPPAMDPQNGAAEFIAAYKKLTGIDLEFIKPAHNQYNERVDLAFASQDLPDLFETVPKYATFAANGALWDATDAWYNSPISQNAHQSVADTIKINGRLYAVPVAHGNGTITYVRRDWLDKLGLSMPKNWEEYHNMLIAFRDRDPDGDGRNNQIPFIAAGVTDSSYLRDFYQGAPGNNPGFYSRDGTIVEGMYDADLHNGFRRLAQCYQEGLIDQEIFTNTTSAARDKFYTGKVGVFTYWAGQWNKNLQDNLAKTVSEGIVEAMPPIEGTYLVDRPGSSISIPAASKNPMGVFKYIAELAFDGGEGSMLFFHGVEGKHWVNENGVYKKLPDGIDPSVLFIKAIYGQQENMYPWKDPFSPPEGLQYSIDLFNANAHAQMTLPASEDITGLQAELVTARSEIVAKIIMGTYSVEEGVELYRRQNDAAVQQCLTVMNKLYKGQ